MSSTGCIDLQQLDDALRSSKATEHAKDCARCFALLHEHTAFLAEREIDGAQIADAEVRLQDFLRTLPAATGARRPRRLRPWLWGGALAAAIALLVFLPRGNPIPDPPVLRDSSAEALRLHPALSRAGSWELSWDAVDGATEYELRVYDTKLNELIHLGPVKTTRTILSQNRVAAVGTLLWRVIALENGDELLRSEVGILRGAEVD